MMVRFTINPVKQLDFNHRLRIKKGENFVLQMGFRWIKPLYVQMKRGRRQKHKA